MWKGLALGTAALGTGLLLRSEYEKNHFLVEELAIDSPKIQKEHRFIFITDVHDKEFGPGNSRLFKAIRQINPEGIFIGGDVMVSRGRNYTYLNLCSFRRAGFHCPGVLCPGKP